MEVTHANVGPVVRVPGFYGDSGTSCLMQPSLLGTDHWNAAATCSVPLWDCMVVPVQDSFVLTGFFCFDLQDPSCVALTVSWQEPFHVLREQSGYLPHMLASPCALHLSQRPSHG